MLNILNSLTIEITNSCLNECLFCSSNSFKRSTEELEYADIVTTILQSMRLGVRHVSLSGGEPLLHPDLNRIVEDIFTLQQIQTLSIYTSGIVDDGINARRAYTEWGKKFPFTKAIPIFGIQSLSSHEHDKLTTVGGSFDLTIQSLKAAIRDWLKAEVHIVPNKLNIKNLDNSIEYFLSLGVTKVSVLKLVPQGRAKVFAKNLRLDDDDKLILADVVSRYRENPKVRFGIPFSNLTGSKSICCAGTSKLTVMSNGDVVLCEAFKQYGEFDELQFPPVKINPYKISNIRSERLSSIYTKVCTDARFDILKTLTKYSDEPCPAQMLHNTDIHNP